MFPSLISEEEEVMRDNKIRKEDYTRYEHEWCWGDLKINDAKWMNLQNPVGIDLKGLDIIFKDNMVYSFDAIDRNSKRNPFYKNLYSDLNRN